MDEQSIFLAALAHRDDDDRSRFLKNACGSNTELKQRVKLLLQKSYDNGGFLESPAFATSTTIAPSVLDALSDVVSDLPMVALRDAGADGVVELPSHKLPREYDGKYQLHGEIARGGMGVIVKGRDKDLGRELAIKVLHESNSVSPEHVCRFVEEAQISGQLQHPGIAPVYELGKLPDNRPFFSMKLVKGETLAAMLTQRQSLADLSEFLSIFEQVCQTMAYAHSRSVIHRDLKPANIMVGSFGEVQVMDWGLAKVLTKGGKADERRAMEQHKEVSFMRTIRTSQEESETDGGSNTRAGSVMGTFAYMPPEQALGEVERLDARVDVFSLGAMLVEILTQKPPYLAETSHQIHQLACGGKLEECLDRLDACSADAELVQLAKDCLRPDPEDRLRNANEVAERVVAYRRLLQHRVREAELNEVAATTRAKEEHRRHRLSWAISAIMFGVLVAVSIAAVGFNRMAARNEQLRKQAETNRQLAEQRLRRENISRVSAESRALSSEYATASTLLAIEASEMSRSLGGVGQALADAALMQATQAISVAGRPIKFDSAAVVDLRMTDTYVIARCEVHGQSPGGPGHELRIWHYQDDNPAETLQFVGPGFEVQSFDLSRDGRWMVTKGSGLLLWDLQDTPISSRQISAQQHSKMAISDNGHWLVAHTGRADPKLVEEDTRPGEKGRIQLWDLRNRSPIKLSDLECPATTLRSLAVASDGRWVAAQASTEGDLYLWDLENSDEKSPEMAPTQSNYALVFSPDSSRLIAKSFEELVVHDLRRNDPLTSIAAVDTDGYFVRVSPNSQWVFACPSPTELCRWNLDALDSPSLQRLTGPNAGFTSLAMSPNCSWFLGGACDGTARLWGNLNSLRISDRFVSLQTYQLGPTQLRLSPDGRWIATSYGDGMIRVRDLHGIADPLFLKKGPSSVRHAPIATCSRGRWIASATNNNEVMLWDTEAKTKEETIRMLGSGAEVGHLAFDARGQKLIAGNRDGTFAIWHVEHLDAAQLKRVRVVGVSSRRHPDAGAFAISHDGQLLATGHSDSFVRIWDLSEPDSSKPKFSLRGHSGLVHNLLFSPNGRWLVTTDQDTDDKSVRLWDLKAEDPESSSKNLGHTGQSVYSLTIDSASRWLGAGCGRDVRLWDLTQPNVSRPHKVLSPQRPEEDDNIYELQISPDSRWLFTSRVNATAQLFDLSQDNPVSKNILTPGVQDSQISSDGHWLAMCKRGSNLQLFDLTADDPTRTWRVLTCPGDTLWRLDISADSRWLVTSSGEGTVRRWNLDMNWLLSYAQEMAGRELTSQERELYGLSEN